MFRRKKFKKEEYDRQLLDEIQRLKQEWESLERIMEHSIDASEKGLMDLRLVEAKYFYLLKEARQRKIRANH
ncbi:MULTISPECIES: YaaL family protein [Pontibacillus]|uniref:YaaL family protein n=1 Tax=Pontibacillus chungwhensis TaxID=265426 RepID=A0ABY8UWY4_9BACI|nr:MULTISPECIES: YaaL family protein [Pontibacillus]MCD5325576.1 YaaL family protein [Pontibacillus sp. HN14]WIF98175.1 YaaL family protein [Pontibacillus chungwhensis]